MSLATHLTSTNLIYRRPDLCDYLADTGVGLATVVDQLTNGSVRSVLDLGCATGRHLAALHADHGCDAVGVDVQPGLIRHGRETHPELELVLGDIRSVRLGRQFDLVLCLGNSLSYQLTDADLQATIKTFGTHTRPGGHVVIATMLQPSHGNGTAEVDNELVTAAIEFESSWDPDSRIVTTRRIWRYPDGSADQDTMRRRVTPIDELTGLLIGAAFTDVHIINGHGAFVVARKTEEGVDRSPRCR